MDLDKYPEIRFCRVRKGTKKPFETDWVNKPYTFEEIQKYLPEENYGVLCGYGDLAVIDSDTPELQLAVESLLPETFRVKTGSGGTHNYFFIPNLSGKRVLTTFFQGQDKHWGEVQWKGQQVVGAGSIHPNGNKYEILNNLEIQRITEEQLIKAISPFMKEIQQAEIDSKNERKNYGGGVDDLRVTDIWGLGGLKTNHKGEYFGEHPIHGSTGGMNFWINPSKNVWKCFRCDSGGGPLSAIAVKEGIIDCSQAKAGYLRGDLARTALKIAHERYGLENGVPQVIEKTAEIEIKKQEIMSTGLTLWTYKDYANLRKEKNFVVDRVIYPKTVSMLYSPPAQFKSIISLSLALAVSKGLNWMNFKTKKMPVLYCDKENNDQINKLRIEGLMKGYCVKKKTSPFYVLRREGDLLDDKFIFRLKKAIDENKIKLVVFDTLHRFADYDENKSDDINRIYTKVFQPLVEEYGVSIIFLHHTRKDGGYRGSGDFLGMVDTCYAVFRDGKTNKFQLVNEKSRVGEIETVIGEIDFGEDFIKLNRLNESDEADRSLGKLKELTQKVRSCFSEGLKLKRKDIEDRFELEGYQFSVSTLKRALKWLVDTTQLDRDDKGRYSLIQR